LRYLRMLMLASTFLLATIGTISSASAAGVAGPPHPSVLDHFAPGPIVPGHWRLIEGPQTVYLNVGAISGCNGSARTWRRQDGVQIRLLWAVCGSQQISLLAKSYAVSQARASAAWRGQSTLGAQVDLVQLAPGGRVWRFWLQGNLDLAIETTCGHLPVGPCASLATPAAHYLAARLPGQPRVTLLTTLVPPASGLLGALVTLALVLVGGNRLSNRAKLEKFHMSVNDPHLRSVDALADRLRKMSRRQWYGKVLAITAAIVAVGSIAKIISGSVGPGVIEALVAISFGIAGRKLLRLSRHPLLSRKRSYALDSGSVRPRALLSIGFTLFLSLLSLAVPLLVLAGWILAGLAQSEQDLSPVLAGLVIAAVASGYFVDRAAQRLRAYNTQQAMEHDKRPPVLYLRNFGDDAQKIPASRFSRKGPWQRSTAWLNPVGNARLEEVFTRALAVMGPIIATAPAGGKLRRLSSAIAPPLGAAKSALANKEWQTKVEEWARKARAVVVSANPRQLNDGLKWELDTLATKVAHGKVILIFGTGSKADLHRRFGTFLSVAGRYPLFAGLASGWMAEGTLVLVHVPADGWGTWYGWGAERRTAWTYTAAVSEAMKFAATAWERPLRNSDPLRGVPQTETVITALHHATDIARRRGRATDTKTLMLALMDADATGRWNRIELNGGSRQAIEQAAVEDPPLSPFDQRNNSGLTGACATALMTAVRLSRQLQLDPMPPGVLALGLIADRSNAACRALAIGDEERQRYMANMISEELLGISLGDLRLGTFA
jgi:hypothetical protein